MPGRMQRSEPERGRKGKGPAARRCTAAKRPGQEKVCSPYHKRALHDPRLTTEAPHRAPHPHRRYFYYFYYSLLPLLPT